MNKDTKAYAMMAGAAAVVLCVILLVGVIGEGPAVKWMPGTDEKNVTHYVQATVQMWMAESAHGYQGVYIKTAQGNLTSVPPQAITMFPTQEGADICVVVEMTAPDGQVASVQQQFSHAELEAHTYNGAWFIEPWYEIGLPFGVSASGLYTLTFSVLHSIGGVWTDTPVSGDSGPLQLIRSVVVP